DFILVWPGDGDGADVAESPEAVVIARAHAELHNLERAAKVDVEAAFLGFAVERRGAVNYRIGGVNEARVVITGKSEARGGEITQENMDARIDMGFKLRGIHVQLKRAPQAAPSFPQIARTHQ